jgi:hypothetical protein
MHGARPDEIAPAGSAWIRGQAVPAAGIHRGSDPRPRSGPAPVRHQRPGPGNLPWPAAGSLPCGGQASRHARQFSGPPVLGFLIESQTFPRTGRVADLLCRLPVRPEPVIRSPLAALADTGDHGLHRARVHQEVLNNSERSSAPPRFRSGRCPELTVAVTTRYGTLAPQPLAYVVS